MMTAVKRGQAFEVGSFPGPKRGLEFAAASARVRLRLTSLRIISSETCSLLRTMGGPWCGSGPLSGLRASTPPGHIPLALHLTSHVFPSDHGPAA